MANTPYYTKAEIEALYPPAGGSTVSETFNQVLQFNKNKYNNTAVAQSSAIAFSLAASGHVDGVVIRQKIMSDGTNTITFPSGFNVFNKSEDDVYPSGLHIFYFNYLGGDVDVAIPTYQPEVSEPSASAPTVPQNLASSNIGDTSFTLSWDASTSEDSFTWSYKIYKDGTYLKTVPQEELSTTIGGLTPNTTYSFTVSAIDDQDRESAQSSALQVTTDEEVLTASTPAELGMELWRDGTDEATMTIVNTDRVSAWENKINDGDILSQSNDSLRPIKNVDHLSFSSGRKMSGSSNNVLSTANDYHFFAVIQVGYTDVQNKIYGNTISSDNRFGLFVNADELRVGYNDGGANTKSIAFTDTSSYHIVEMKKTGNTVYAELDGVEMTGSNGVYMTGNTGEYLGDPVIGNNESAFSVKCICAKSTQLSSQERTELLNYLNTL